MVEVVHALHGRWLMGVEMVTYAEMVAWTQDFDALANVVGVLNDMLGCKYQHADGNPLALSYCSGCYLVTCDGNELARFGVYDSGGVADALRRLREWSSCVWAMRRSGRIVVDSAV